jgi:hypothetical protein
MHQRRFTRLTNAHSKKFENHCWAVALHVMFGVSQSGYFGWRGRPACCRQRDDMVLLADVRSAFALSSGTYCSPRMTRELRDSGLTAGRRRIARLMRENGLRARQKRRFKQIEHLALEGWIDPLALYLVPRTITDYTICEDRCISDAPLFPMVCNLITAFGSYRRPDDCANGCDRTLRWGGASGDRRKRYPTGRKVRK